MILKYLLTTFFSLFTISLSFGQDTSIVIKEIEHDLISYNKTITEILKDTSLMYLHSLTSFREVIKRMQFNKINGAAHWQMTLIRGRDVAFKSDNSFIHEWVDSTKNISLNEFGGYFFSGELDIKFEVKSQKEYLELNIRGYDKPIKMQCIFKDYFSDPDFGGLNFQRNSKGKISGFTFINMKANNILFKKFTF